ncbi:MAG: hypothetical protein IT342_08850 [Candidatus Melainabacteria bacterium]|nr:hypothetical protein [Candidatus Melainabacteria bacterium]
MTAPREIADRAVDLVTGTRPEDQTRLNREVNDLLRTHNVNGTNAISEQVTRQMEQQGVLPQLLIQEAGRLNVDGQGGISRQDLQSVIDNRENRHQPLTVLAARHAMRNFNEIDNHSWYRFGNNRDELTEVELREHSDRNTVRPARSDAPLQPGSPPRQYDQPPNPADVRQQNIDILNGRDGNAQTKFRAIEAIARLGNNRITLTDAEGRQLNCRVEVTPISPGSNRNYVHLYETDSNGRERILLRAVGRDGQYSQQVGSDGRPVPFTGSEWNRRFPNSNLGIR